LRSDKKIQERSILDHFRKNFPDFPSGKIRASEAPDFLLKKTPKNVFGIELAHLPTSKYIINNKWDFHRLETDIHLIINKKEERFSQYMKNRANEYWLILHADSLQTGSFRLIDHLDKITTGKAFDRIFLFALFEGTVYSI
jgi:hypothetical protein